MDRTEWQENKGRKFRLSRFGGIVAALTVVDFVLFSYILSGYVISSHIAIPDRRVATMARAYDASMKPSPQILWKPVRKQAKATIPVIDASSVPDVTNVSTNLSGAAPPYQNIPAPNAVPQSEPAASLSRATKRSSTT